MFNRSTEVAIAAMSRLTEVYGSDQPMLTAGAIARDRHVPRPFVAKVLTVLSQRGLVRSTPGRGGGYALARPPEQISLYDIAVLFERFSRPTPCPFGPGHCGEGCTPCPLHDKLSALQAQLAAFLQETTLAVFLPPREPPPAQTGALPEETGGRPKPRGI